jgi:hypothetical protein
MSYAFDLALKNAKKNFFDRAAVVRAVASANAKNLRRVGAFIRTRARSLIGKKKKGASAPGKPPHSHVGTLRRFIFFGLDQSKESVAIGPVLVKANTQTAPKALEFGGQSVGISQGKRKVKNIRARPFMRPALEAERNNIPEIWRNSVKAR